MKESRFNVITEQEDGSAVFYNSLTNCLSAMDKKSYRTFKVLKDTAFEEKAAIPETAEMIAQLKKGGYLINEAIDELESLRERYETLKARQSMLRLYVIPTSACNFDCKYCYYAGPGVTKMPEDVQDALLAFTGKRLAGKRTLNVIWTGGEPTLAPDVVARLSKEFMKRAKEAGAGYTAAVFTNGYLFDRDMAERFRDNGVVIAQFVLDGPRAVHDGRRPLAGGAGTYDVIMRNLADVAGIMNIAVRINFDAANMHTRYISDLLDALKQCGLPKSTIIELAPVTGYTSQCSDYVKIHGLKKKEIADRLAELYPLVYDSGFTPKFNICQSVSPCTTGDCFGVSKDGDLYRCFLLIGEERERMGSVLDDTGLEKNRNNTKWNAWDPFSKTNCRKCNLFPVCGGSGCPLYDVVEDGFLREDVPCVPLKFYLDDAMELYFRMQKERKAAGHAV